MRKILPGSTIGIVGGGQLGRMLCMAAKKLGYRTITLTPRTSEPASAEEVTDEIIYANYDDENALKTLADKCDVITFEFENIPHTSIELLESLKPTHPSSKAIYTAQNRARERQFFKDNKLPTHKFENISSASDAINFLNGNSLEKAIIKTSDFGYDGKGQLRISTSDNIEEKWLNSGFKKAIIEEFVPFTMEISVIIARNEQGDITNLPIGQNIHENGILRKSIVPANIGQKVKSEAVAIAKIIAELLDYIGVMAVEFFVLENGSLYINEIAPRVHNSGHWSLDGCQTSQFEQHIRAICGLEFGACNMTVKRATMENILGLEMHDISKYEGNKNTFIHDYKKPDIREGRKLAHVNIIE